MRLGARCNMQLAIVRLLTTFQQLRSAQETHHGKDRRACNEIHWAGPLAEFQSWLLAILDRCQGFYRSEYDTLRRRRELSRFPDTANKGGLGQAAAVFSRRAKKGGP